MNESQIKSSSSLSSYRLLVCLFIVCALSVYLLANFVGPLQFYLPLVVSSNNSQPSESCQPIRSGDYQYKIEIDGTVYPQYLPNYLNKSIDFNCLNKNNSTKTILLWNPFFSSADYGYGLGVREPFVRNKCPVTNCEMTNNVERISDADLVIVHMRNAVGKPPTTRPRKQRWVFMLYESPVHSADFKNYNRFFNLTATYRMDTEFANLYEKEVKYEWKLNKSFDETYDFHGDKLDNKNKLATAVISNCGASTKRLEYIKAMQREGKIDVFGKCGAKCPSNYRDGRAGTCKEILATEYMFYLAFENSYCKDYVTEKFFEVLNYNIVPVVMGGGNYSYFIPRSGYINSNDFKSPKELTDYLHYLSENKTAYNSYFKWKKHISFNEDKSRPGFTTFCSMCIHLHLEDHYGIETKIRDDLSGYWSKSENCKNPKIDKDSFQF